MTIGDDGRFTIGKIGTVYSSDTTLLTNYWRSKRQLEVFSWTPLSDTTVYDRLNTFLEGAKGTITEPKQLLGDFGMLVGGFFYRDTERFMQWCCEHPESQLTKGMVINYKEVSPEWLLDQLKKIKDPLEKIREEDCVEGLVVEVHRRTCEARIGAETVTPVSGSYCKQRNATAAIMTMADMVLPFEVLL